ncbi:MAG: LCP family protein [Lachnospiraceae bacterium]|nr:LCP family protein [Lachnospiraceae bacterium]
MATSRSNRSAGRSAGSRGKKRRHKKLKIFLLVAEFIVLLIMLGVAFVFIKGDKIQKDETIGHTDAALSINDELSEMEQVASEQGGDWNMSGYTTIALFGVDSRNKTLGKGNRTDTIMIAGLNEATGEIKLCSYFRDTYCNVGNDTYNKANMAYSRGGPEQAIQMLNTCLDLDIRDYITVDFYALIDLIDLFGGVEIDVKEAEIEHLNNYQISMVGKEDGLNAFGEQAYTATPGVDYTPVTTPGLQNLNGLQATAYCRIRYVGNDFERAERQRTVLLKLSEKASKASVTQLNSAIDTLFPKILTSFSSSDLVAYASKASTYKVTSGDGFPFNRVTGTMGKAGSCVVAENFAEDVKTLHTFMYGEDSYTPTARVMEISDKVAVDKAKYLGNK